MSERSTSELRPAPPVEAASSLLNCGIRAAVISVIARNTLFHLRPVVKSEHWCWRVFITEMFTTCCKQQK